MRILMRMIGWLVLCSALVLSLGGCRKPETPEQVDDATLSEAAFGFIDSTASGRYGEAVDMMNAQMAAAMSADSLEMAWESIVAQVGKFGGIVGTRNAVESGYRCCYVTCRFASAHLDAKVVFDSVGKVAGLWFSPPQVAIADYKEPPYVQASTFREIECTVGEGEWSLPATLTIPSGQGPFPGVVLVHGSGPQDRDESYGPNKPFKDIAWGLATDGVAVLRYEKRTHRYPGETAATMQTLTMREETVDDAIAAVTLLAASEGVDPSKIYVLGHSLGAHAAPRIASLAKDSSRVKVGGIIMLAPNARHLAELVVIQTEYLLSLSGDAAGEVRDELERARLDAAKILEGKVEPGEVVFGASKAYWDDLASYDALGTASALEIPILLMQGERDYQVTLEDFALWEKALDSHDRATLRLFPELNHFFMKGEGAPSPQEYLVQSNVDEKVVEQIAAWLKGL